MRNLHQLMTGILLLVTTGLFAQKRQITGKVTDASGAPVPAATIKIKGTKIGTSADFEGAFKLDISDVNTLIISGIGYETKEVKVGNATSLIIQLNTDSKSLSEVVVTGAGTATSKRKLGIAVQSVSADKLPQAPTASIDQALVGKIAGAQISSISGNPGDPVNIVLRGINTVQNGTKPLILMDGVEIHTDLNSLDLSNIENVEVVQGAASAALYGAQGANGVIQIFTKKGRKGQVQVNYSSGYALNEFLNNGNVHKSMLHPYLTDGSNNLVDGSGNMLAINSAGYLTGISYKYGGATRYGILDPRNTNSTPYNANLKYYDHFKQVFKTGNTLNNSINVSGGSERGDFSITASNNRTVSAIMKNGVLDRSNLTANLGTELFKGFKIRSITQVVYTRNTLHPGLGASGGWDGGKGNKLGDIGGVYSFLNTSPFFDLTGRLSDGTYPGYQKAVFVSINAFNPYYRQEYTSGLGNKVNVIQNFDANLKVNKFVELDVKYGIDFRTENSRWTYYNQSTNLNTIALSSWTSNYGTQTGEIDNWQYTNTFENFLPSLYIRTDLERDFGLKLPIQTTTEVAFDYRKNKYGEYDTYGVGLPLVPPINITATSSQAVARDYIEPFVTYGYLVNQKIDIGDWGGVTGGFRSDWSSAFGGGSKPFTFPHGDGYFLPSSLDFWKDSKLSDVVPYVKLRAGYGEAGIQPGAFDRYPTLNQQNLGSSLIYTLPATRQNANLNVEVSKEFESGVDYTVNLNKDGQWLTSASGFVNYWKRKSKNVIYTLSVPPSTGYSGLLDNAIDLSSNGVEFSLNLSAFHSRNLTWNFTTNFGHQTSMVDRISGGQVIPLNSAAGSTQEVLQQGHRIGQIYAYKTLRSTSDTYQDGSKYIVTADAGKYAVVNGTLIDTATKGIMFSGETYPIGDGNPRFNMSFINDISYKGFLNLSFQFDWIYGSHLYNQTKEWMYRDGISGDFDKPVTINGKTAAYTAYWASAYYGLWGSSHGSGNNATKDFFYEGASFLRLRNIALSADFAKIFNLKSVKRLQLVLTGRNLLTVTKYTGYDPEVSSGGVNSAWDRGVDHSTLPNVKSYQVGLNVGF